MVGEGEESCHCDGLASVGGRRQAGDPVSHGRNRIEIMDRDRGVDVG